jgi:hypothetical protein
MPGRTEESDENLSQESRREQDSKQAVPEYNSKRLLFVPTSLDVLLLKLSIVFVREHGDKQTNTRRSIIGFRRRKSLSWDPETIHVYTANN